MREGDTPDELDRLMLTDPDALRLSLRLIDAARRTYAEAAPDIGPELARQIIAETYSGDLTPEEMAEACAP